MTELDDGHRDRSKLVLDSLGSAGLVHDVFLAEANSVGYTTTGLPSSQNDLYTAGPNDGLDDDQTGTILGEWRRFRSSPSSYGGRTMPDCMSMPFDDLWVAHQSNRLDPKYHLFEREAARPARPGWKRAPIGTVMRRRSNLVEPELEPDRNFKVMTISQTGEIRLREAGKGNNPPEWLGSYLQDMPSAWYAAKAGDIVYSSIDLWKGCIAVVPPEFDEAIVTKEFPIYEVIDPDLSVQFLQCVLRSRYYQRAFRAITTGHSNRRRTQLSDFEALEISYPSSQTLQQELIGRILEARGKQRDATETLQASLLEFSDLIDGRGAEQLPEIQSDEVEETN